jgi:DNA-binding Xre family transcriptional regulator
VDRDIIVLNQSGSLQLRGRIGQVLHERGMTNRDLIAGLGERHVGTGYRLLSGMTRDPRVSTVLEVCQALAVDPDELLHVSRAPLDSELEMLLAQVRRLDEEDGWLLIDVLRAICRRSTQ